MTVRTTPFPEGAVERSFKSHIAARLAIADALGRPLGTLAAADIAFIDAVLAETLERDVVLTRIRERFRQDRGA